MKYNHYYLCRQLKGGGMEINMKICVVKYHLNNEVTSEYLDNIGRAIQTLGIDCVFVYSIKEAAMNDADYIIVSICTDALYLHLHKRKYLYWAQGIWPEENYMKNHDLFRYLVYSWIERLAIRKSKFTFMVSYELKRHYEKKYKMNFKENYYIMPCSNEKFHSEVFSVANKYKDNVFCYAGGTAVWQCLDETLKLYKKIEDKYTNVSLLLLVKDKNVAKKKIEQLGIKNYYIDYVSVNELKDVLQSVKFGFVLRKPNKVNSVATPTKISTYLTNGIIPIYSNCLNGINKILESTRFKVSYENNYDITKIESFMMQSLSPISIKEEFWEVYRNEYDESKHILQIAEKLRFCFKL